MGSSDTPELKPHQIRDIYFEFDEPFLVETRRNNKYFIYVGLSLFVMVLILSFIIKIPREIHLDFKLSGGLKEVIGQYPDQVFIKEKYAKVNEQILSGTPIVKISSERIVHSLKELVRIASAIEKLNSSEKILFDEGQRFLRLGLNNAKEQVALLSDHKKRREQHFANEQHSLTKQFENATIDLDRHQKLFDLEVIPKRTLELKEDVFEQTQFEIYTSKQRFQTAMISIEEQHAHQKRVMHDLQKQMVLDSLKRYDKQYALIQQKSIIEHQLTLSFGNYNIHKDGLVVNSPNAGLISYITEEESQIESGNFVWKIQSGDEPFKVFCKANSSQIGSLKKSQAVILKFNSYPYFYYGTAKGEIMNISAVTKTQGEYLIEIQLNEKGTLNKELIKGMEGEASIVIEDLPLIYYLFRYFSNKK